MCVHPRHAENMPARSASRAERGPIADGPVPTVDAADGS
jgi:hypothetical protein